MNPQTGDRFRTTQGTVYKVEVVFSDGVLFLRAATIGHEIFRVSQEYVREMLDAGAWEKI